MYKKGAYRNDYLYLFGRIRKDFTEKTVHDLRHKVDGYLVTAHEGRPDPKKVNIMYKSNKFWELQIMAAFDVVKTALIESTTAIRFKINIPWSLVFRY